MKYWVTWNKGKRKDDRKLVLFSSRDGINSQLRTILDDATDRWGCKIDRVEIKDITPPADIRL